jgi:Zn2+/Cd2+-exporting ATPase
VKNERCVLHDLAEHLSREPRLDAVRVDAGKKTVSFACRPDCDEAHARAELQRVLAPFQPGDLPTCTGQALTVDCQTCEQGRRQPLPDGVRLMNLDDHSVLLERVAVGPAVVAARWRNMPWRVTPIIVPEGEGHDWRAELARATVCGGAMLVGFLLEKLGGDAAYAWALASYSIAIGVGSYDAALDVWHLLRQRVLDVHFLMLTVAFGAALVGHWWEGAMLMFLFSLSGALEAFAMARTKREIQSLFKEAPRETTTLNERGEEVRTAVELVSAGMTLRVRPGEQFAVDAEVIDGASAADESTITGESIPVDKRPGERVLAGTMNLWGRLDCRVLRGASESSLSRIIRLIREAQESKAPSQRFTDRFGSAYTHGILAFSVVMFMVWWLAAGLPVDRAFYRTMTLLVVASPCALVLSIPSAILAGIAAGARRGILFRGGVAIEKLADITRVALDKTGTLTTGRLEVVALEARPAERESELLAVAAGLAHHATHPVSEGITRAAQARGRSPSAISDFQQVTGQGVQGRADGMLVRMGRRTMMDGDWTAAFPQPQVGQTETFVELPGLRGRILLRDELRTASRPLLEQLAAAGLKLTMLSGDRAESAQHVAAAVGLHDVQSGLSPEDKVRRIQSWGQAGERVAMVGDGINDAPSLAAAYVGVAMGLRGSDAALEQADVVLTQDRLERFFGAYRISRRARLIIRQNLVVSLGSVAVLVCAAIFGLIPLTVGVIGHEGSTVVVVMNSLRLLWIRNELPGSSVK